MASESGGTAVIFSNYNYAFVYFNAKYVELCLGISETMSLRTVRRKVSAFMYEFRYAIPSSLTWDSYKERLDEINYGVNADTEFAKIFEKDDITFKEEVKAYPLYYSHFLKYLELLSGYVGELSATYMPRTKMQRTLLKYKNDSPFYDKLHEFKATVFQRLSDFKINKFRVNTNTFITFFYAYKLFINEIFVKRVEEVLGIALSIFISEETINLLGKYPGYNSEDLRKIYVIETILHDAILECNSLVNLSLSSYGVLPKIQPKVYSDRTLI